MPEDKKPKPVIIDRPVKHQFTDAEMSALARKLGGELDQLNAYKDEFDSIKSTWKGKIETSEANVSAIGSLCRSGFEFRITPCVVTYDVPAKLKRFFVADTNEPAGEEKMTAEDYQQELLQAESVFDRRETIPLYDANTDKGVIVVGALKGKWFAAARLNVGAKMLTQRLDSEQKSFKSRFDAIQAVSKGALSWIEENVDVKAAKGFVDVFQKAIEPHKERAE